MEVPLQYNNRPVPPWPYPRRGDFENRLKAAAAMWFRTREYKVEPGAAHNPAAGEGWTRNIILPAVASYIEELREKRNVRREPFAFHSYLQNALSSQALLFNLVGPLLVNNDLEPLRQALGSRGIPLPRDPMVAQLEYSDRSIFNEKSPQPTSLDLALGQLDHPGALFIEVKLVESGFGGCSVYRRGDCDGANPAADPSRCYLHHIGRSYWALLNKHGFLQTGMESERTCLLASHYQFFREALFAIEKRGYLVLLTDPRSPTFHCTGPFGERGILPLLMSFVPNSLRTYVRQVNIGDIVSAIERCPEHSWIREFKSKYAM
jgi:hypothetical protein